MSPLTLALCCIILASSATVARAATVRMSSDSSCPSDVEFAAAVAASDSGVRQIVGVSDSRVCSVSCASWDLCAVSRFVSSSRICQLATQSGWLRLWRLSNDTGCVSLVRPPTPPSTLFSKLLALYNFRFSSENVAAGNPNALPSIDGISTAVRVPRVGYRFDDLAFSYLQVDLGSQPLWARLPASNKKITFFAKVSPNNAYSYVLHTLYNRSRIIETLVYSSKWSVDIANVVSFEAIAWSNLKYSTVGQAASSTNPFSAAVSLDSSASGAMFYYNGSVIATAATGVASGATSGDEVLRIGYDTSFPFLGIVHCYAIIADSLGFNDLLQLDQVC